MMTIKEIQFKIEKQFKRIKLRNHTYGFQIQPNTRFLKGISRKEIEQLELLFGFDFPWEYREMLLSIGGFDTVQISIDPSNEDKTKYDDFFLPISKRY